MTVARSFRGLTPVPPVEEPLMTLAAVCERLSMPVQTFYDARKHGRGPRGFKIGGKLFFRWSEVDAWLETQREPLR